jgi:hypothetical protein
MDYSYSDGYKLYDLLEYGEAITITHKGTTYTFRFMGERIGFYNYLSVTNQDGEEKKFGWGWDSAQVFQALNHLEQGWDTEQVPRYRPYNAKKETEGAS